jgi:adenine-specific DNA-methyltransferase
MELCAARGAGLSALSSSWAPFIIVTSTLLKPGGRLAFVVPAEIGHAPYARPVLEHLLANFAWVQVCAVRRKLFPELSEDCWLLYCDGFGGSTHRLALSIMDVFQQSGMPPTPDIFVDVADWRRWRHRLRPYLVGAEVRATYRELADSPHSMRLRDVASVGVGYVTGANDFFHLRPSQAERARIPDHVLCPAVRNGRCLSGQAITSETVAAWRRGDEPMLLLRLDRTGAVPRPVKKYLDSAAGVKAREAYKCRSRDPWYAVPQVSIPDAFLSYMSGGAPVLAANHAGCVATNSVHVVKVSGRLTVAQLQERWRQPITKLSCELEGHPLGGGMLKLEPREAGNVLLADGIPETLEHEARIAEGLDALRSWRHYVGPPFMSMD